MVTAKIVIAKLGIPEYQLYRLVHRGVIPAHEQLRQPWHDPRRKSYLFRVSEVAAALGIPIPE